MCELLHIQYTVYHITLPMSSEILSTNPSEPLISRRANDYIAKSNSLRAPAMLFDEFWRERELALLFGPPGSGKSVFALQLADALSRGTGLYGFRLPRWRRRVLYVDLRHTDEQFQIRSGESGPAHKFPRNLFRERPPAGQEMCEWLRAIVMQHKMQVVIIDDLAALKTTADGTRETLRVMRALRDLRGELQISILVLADSGEPARGRPIAESDLGRSRVLCSAADSVFAAGRNLRHMGDHYLVQTRSRSTRLFWTAKNAPIADIVRDETGLLVFEFDARFTKVPDEKQRRLICQIARLQEVEHKSLREIAALLGISKSWASKLYKKWIPAMGAGDEPVVRSQEPEVAAPSSGQELEVRGQYEPGEESVPLMPEHELADAHDEAAAEAGIYGRMIQTGRFWEVPFAAGLGRRSIYDLERRVDRYGDEIYVESTEEPTGRPVVWYTRNSKGLVTRWERDLFGSIGTAIGKSEWI